MRPRIEAEVLARGIKASVTALCDLDQVEKGTEVVLVGTVAKLQPLRPSILKELSEDNGLQPQLAARKARYVSDEDDLIMEDDTQRIKLRGNVDKDKMATGVVVGVLGREKESGKFEVTEMFFAAVAPQPERPIPEKERFVKVL